MTRSEAIDAVVAAARRYFDEPSERGALAVCEALRGLDAIVAAETEYDTKRLSLWDAVVSADLAVDYDSPRHRYTAEWGRYRRALEAYAEHIADGTP